MIDTLPQKNWNPQALKDALACPHVIPPPGKQPLTKAESKAAAFESAIISAPDLAKTEIETRENVIPPFFKTGDLGFVYGRRGSGKSWIGLILANAVAGASEYNGQLVTKPRRVLYVDGEMPLDAIQDRQAALAQHQSAHLLFLNHERLFDTASQVLNLAEPEAQQALDQVIAANDVEVLVLDNLSCLFYGVKENEADAWEAILPWLLYMRNRKVAVIIVAHAGRNGEMRGTSRREDQAFWIMKVTEANMPDGFRGLKFRTCLTKNRNAVHADCPPLEWSLSTNAHGRMDVKTIPVTHDCAVLSAIADGFTGATEVADELGLSKGRISQLVKGMKQQGLIRTVHREYELTELGQTRLTVQPWVNGGAKRERMDSPE